MAKRRKISALNSLEEESKAQNDKISFDLMVRSKTSTVVKIKKLDKTNIGLLPNLNLPLETDEEFKRSRVTVSTLRGERL